MKVYYAKDSGDSKTAASTHYEEKIPRQILQKKALARGRDHDRCSEGVRRCIVSDRKKGSVHPEGYHYQR